MNGPSTDQTGTGPLEGLAVLVTGTLDGLSRTAATDAVTALGGRPVASVSGRTDLVVVGDGAGVSKMAKARALGLRVLDGPAFAALHVAYAADPTAWLAAWDGTPPGEPVADYDARHAEPAAPAEPYIPLAQRHLLTQSTVYPRTPSGVIRQVRLSCTCGHYWLGSSVHARAEGCPTERGETRQTQPPWA